MYIWNTTTVLYHTVLYCTVLYCTVPTNITVQFFICMSPVLILAAIPNVLTLLVPLHNSYNKIPRRTPKYFSRDFYTILIYRIV